MKKYLIIISLFTIILLVSACNSGRNQPEKVDVKDVNVGSGISVANDIFGQDFSKTVIWQNVSSWKLLWYYSQPQIKGNYPWIIIIHEWWWLNDQIKYMADLLANDWYKVFAIDLYSGEVATTQEKAMELSAKVRDNSTGAIEKLWLAYDYLKNTQKVPRIASLWWCFWWWQSLNLSLSKKLDATVIYYWNLITEPDKLKNISWPVLWIFWENDTTISVDSVNKFRDALDKLWVKREIHIYSWVGHAFANPTWNNYGKSQTKNAWKKTVEFLKNNLK